MLPESLTCCLRLFAGAGNPRTSHGSIHTRVHPLANAAYVGRRVCAGHSHSSTGDAIRRGCMAMVVTVRRAQCTRCKQPLEEYLMP